MSINRNKPDRRMIRRRNALLPILLAAACALIIGAYLETKHQQQERGVIQEDIGVLERIQFGGTSYIRKSAVTTILLLGVDRNAEDLQYSARQGGQADFILLYVVSHYDKTVSCLQIDRDMMTDVQISGVFGNPLGTKTMQICLSHGYGTTQQECNQNTIDAIEQWLGETCIDYCVSMDMAGIGVLNTALGGVTVTLEDDFSAFDPVMTQGTTLKLSASQAEIFTRYRIEVGDGSNLGRMQRQRTYFTLAEDRIKTESAENPNFIGDILDALSDHVYGNLSKAQFIAEWNRAYNYTVFPTATIAGTHTVGEEGFMEFYADEEARMQWFVEVFYRPLTI